MDSIAEIKKFLTAKNYLLAPHGAKIARGETYWEAYRTNEVAALNAGLNHWLSEQLGIHWQRLWAYQGFSAWCSTFFYDALDTELVADIEKAIAWHEALEKEAE